MSDTRNTYMELDTMPAKKIRGNSDLMDEYGSKGESTSKSEAPAHKPNASHKNTGQLYRSQRKVRTERDFVPSGFLPPSRPLDCLGIAVVNTQVVNAIHRAFKSELFSWYIYP